MMRRLLLILVGVGLLLIALPIGIWYGAMRVPDRYPGQADQIYREARQRFEQLQATPPEQNSALLLRPLLAGDREQSSQGTVQGPAGPVAPQDLLALQKYEVSPTHTDVREKLAEDPQASARDVRGYNKVVALMKAAVQRPRFVWPARFDDAANRSQPNFRRMRTLARALVVCGLQAEGEGRLGDAVDLFLLPIRFGGQASGQGPLVNEMIAVAIAKSSVDPLLELLDSGKLHAREYRAVLAGLQPAPFRPEGFALAMDGEFAFSLSILDAIRERGATMSTVGEKVDRGDLLVGPILQRERHIYTNYMLANRKYYKDFSLVPPARPDESEFRHSLLAEVLAPDFVKAEIQYRDLLTSLGAARLLAALQLYRLEKGKWPANLGALVPAYLPEIPRNFLNQEGHYTYRVQNTAMALETESPLLRLIDRPGKKSYPPRLPGK